MRRRAISNISSHNRNRGCNGSRAHSPRPIIPIAPFRRNASKANADQTVIGSIKNRKYDKETEPKKNLPKAVPGED